MKQQAIYKFKLKHVSLCILTASTSQVIVGQQVFAEQTADNQEKTESISIIGSNIKRATDVGALPITDLSESDIENTAAMAP